MKTEIDLLDGTLTLGFDHALGFFASLRRGRRSFEFDRFAATYDGDRPLDALLRWLVVHDVFADDDLDEALLAFADLGDDEEQLSPGAALALDVIDALKRGANE